MCFDVIDVGGFDWLILCEAGDTKRIICEV